MHLLRTRIQNPDKIKNCVGELAQCKDGDVHKRINTFVIPLKEMVNMSACALVCSMATAEKR